MPLTPISYIDRRTGQRQTEKVYGAGLLRFLYGNRRGTQWLRKPFKHVISRTALLSRFAGWYQRQSWTRRTIASFIQLYGVDASEFEKAAHDFTSFADFFVRKLKPGSRTLSSSPAIIPADGRYYFFEDLSTIGAFDVKGQSFDVASLLQDTHLAKQYTRASMVVARLCPSDYHRFHFPVDGTPGPSKLINGKLYSVNPWAIRQNVRIFCENKRMLTTMHSEAFGEVLLLEIGATTVGTIVETYSPNQPCSKGHEKGYFNFGGSALILLFPEGTIQFDADLLAATAQNTEILCLMGQSMGQALSE